MFTRSWAYAAAPLSCVAATRTAARVEFPRGFFPPVEPGVGDELEPLSFRHAAELPAHQANLMVAALAVFVRSRLMKSHGEAPYWKG